MLLAKVDFFNIGPGQTCLTGSEAPALGPTLVEAEFSSCLGHTHLVHKSNAIFDKELCVSEPASYPHIFNVTVEPEQLVEDYKTLWEFVGVIFTQIWQRLHGRAGSNWIRCIC